MSPAIFVADAVRVVTYLTCLGLQILCQVWRDYCVKSILDKYTKYTIMIIVPETWPRNLWPPVYLLVNGSFMFHPHLQVED